MRPVTREFVGADHTGGYRNCADSGRARSTNVVRMIPDKSHRSPRINPAFTACVANGDADQPGAVARKLGESSKPEIATQPGALHFLPADARQVTGHQP